ncbi:DinB family protein [Actinophytocola sp.]|uniref:DinB family protein n=1 Tax=Actinophytocola sp. TaxID=1872138 RepID=UPI002ED0A859
MDEKTMLLTFLDAQRAAAVAILDGLDDETLTRAVLPSKWTPLGMVEHLGYAERHWFQEVVTGSAPPLDWLADHAPLTTLRPRETVFAFYRDQCERANAIIAATSLDAPLVGSHTDPPIDVGDDLRWVMLHMIEETARHAGHLDVVRELLDGTTGLAPR